MWHRSSVFLDKDSIQNKDDDKTDYIISKSEPVDLY